MTIHEGVLFYCPFSAPGIQTGSACFVKDDLRLCDAKEHIHQ